MKSAMYVKENVKEIKELIDLMEEFPNEIIADDGIDYYVEAVKCLCDGVQKNKEDSSFEGTLDYWFGGMANEMKPSSDIFTILGTYAGYEAAKKIDEINKVCESEDYYVAISVSEVATFVLKGHESCIGGAMLYAMDGIVDEVKFENLAKLWKENPNAYIQKITHFDPARFITGYIMFASQLF